MGVNSSVLSANAEEMTVSVHYKESCFSYSNIAIIGDVLYDISRKATAPFNPDLMAMEFSENWTDTDTMNCVIMQKNKTLQYYLHNLNSNHFRIEIVDIFKYWDHRCPLVHNPDAVQNKCEHGVDCKYLLKFKYEYNYCKEGYYHLEDKYHPKEECKRSTQCKAFQRLENGGHEFKDECHMVLYTHPPRNRLIKLTQNYSPFEFETNAEKQSELVALNDPTNDEITQNEGDFVKMLIEEVKKNGFEQDLYNKDNKASILSIVEEKMKHPRHIAMGSPLNNGEMLAIILYTGCECNYDLCASLRDGNASKWKWFDYCLDVAISKLAQWEIGDYAVYSGINNVMLNEREIKNGYFKSYVSTSRNAEIAAGFKGETGVLIKIDSRKLFTCCDVSWISKFPDEQEVLFAFYGTGTKWNAKVINQNKNNQFILISTQ